MISFKKMIIILSLFLVSILNSEQIDKNLPHITKSDIRDIETSFELEPFDSLGVVETERYILNKGDIISIQVMEHPEFSKSALRILPDGGIEYPLLGNIKAEGMNVTKLRKIIENKLIPYVTLPVVTIYVDQVYANMINIIGYVRAPGEYQIYEPVKITYALSLAKGITNIREVDRIRLIRSSGDIFDFEINDLWFSDKKTKVKSEILMYPGDTLVIPPPRSFPWHIYTAILATVSLMVTIYTATK